jgi:hypothetical protein
MYPHFVSSLQNLSSHYKLKVNQYCPAEGRTLYPLPGKCHYLQHNTPLFSISTIRKCLTLSPPAVKTQWVSQCQAFQHLVRSSHTLVNWIFDLLNRFSISLACFWKLWTLFASVCNINTLGQWKEALGQTSQSLCSSFSVCVCACEQTWHFSL